jgi:hypothetical protein
VQGLSYNKSAGYIISNVIKILRLLTGQSLDSFKEEVHSTFINGTVGIFITKID